MNRITSAAAWMSVTSQVKVTGLFGDKTQLYGYVIIHQMHTQVLEIPAGPVYDIPLCSVNVEVGGHPESLVLVHGKNCWKTEPVGHSTEG